MLCQWTLDCGFLELYSGFQSPGFRIPRQKFAGFRIPRAKIFRIALHGARNRQDSGSENVSNRAIFRMILKNGFGKSSLFVYQPTDEKIKTWTLRSPAKENPNMEKAFFGWPVTLQYNVKAKYRLISRKFSGIQAFVPVRETNQIALFSFV